MCVLHHILTCMIISNDASYHMIITCLHYQYVMKYVAASSNSNQPKKGQKCGLGIGSGGVKGSGENWGYYQYMNFELQAVWIQRYNSAQSQSISQL